MPATRETWKAYRPSTGTEGQFFMSAWCENCRRESYCSILTNSMAFGVNDKGYPKQWVYGESGPTCTAFEDKHSPRPSYRCKRTPDLFA